MIIFPTRKDILLFDGEDVEDPAQIVAGSDVRKVDLRLCSNSRHKDLDFLLAFPEISSLKVSSIDMIDVTAISRMEKLKSLRLELSTNVSFDFETLEPQTLKKPYHAGRLILTFGSKRDFFRKCPCLTSRTWEYGSIKVSILDS